MHSSPCRLLIASFVVAIKLGMRGGSWLWLLAVALLLSDAQGGWRAEAPFLDDEDDVQGGSSGNGRVGEEAAQFVVHDHEGHGSHRLPQREAVEQGDTPSLVAATEERSSASSSGEVQHDKGAIQSTSEKDAEGKGAASGDSGRQSPLDKIVERLELLERQYQEKMYREDEEARRAQGRPPRTPESSSGGDGRRARSGESMATDSNSLVVAQRRRLSVDALEDDNKSLLDIVSQGVFEYVTTYLTPPTDRECSWDYRLGKCVPRCRCKYQPMLGDYTLSRSCRLNRNQTELASCDPRAVDIPLDVKAQTLASNLVVAASEMLERYAPETDAECDWNWHTFHCEPRDDCRFCYKLGDYHIGRSCRLREDEQQSLASSGSEQVEEWQEEDRS